MSLEEKAREWTIENLGPSHRLPQLGALLRAVRKEALEEALNIVDDSVKRGEVWHRIAALISEGSK